MSLLLRRRELLCSGGELIIPLTTTNWSLNKSNLSTLSIDDTAGDISYSIDNLSSGVAKSEYIYTNQNYDLTKYNKCYIEVTLNSLSTTKTSGAAAYTGISLAACETAPPSYSSLTYATPTERVSRDWGNRYHFGIYRDTSSSYAQLDPGDYVVEYDLTNFNNFSSNRYIVIHLSCYYYTVNYTITSIKFV